MLTLLYTTIKAQSLIWFTSVKAAAATFQTHLIASIHQHRLTLARAYIEDFFCSFCWAHSFSCFGLEIPTWNDAACLYYLNAHTHTHIY